MPKILNIPFFPQQADGYCLPACTQMVLAHLGISRSQAVLGRGLGVIEGVGVPAPNAEQAPIATPLDDFLLAWYEMDNTYAVITKR